MTITKSKTKETFVALEGLQPVKNEIKKYLDLREKKIIDFISDGLGYSFDPSSVVANFYGQGYQQSDAVVKLAWYRVYGLNGRELLSDTYNELMLYCRNLAEAFLIKVEDIIRSTDPYWNKELSPKKHYTARHDSWMIRVRYK